MPMCRLKTLIRRCCSEGRCYLQLSAPHCPSKEHPALSVRCSIVFLNTSPADDPELCRTAEPQLERSEISCSLSEDVIRLFSRVQSSVAVACIELLAMECHFGWLFLPIEDSLDRASHGRIERGVGRERRLKLGKVQ